MGTLLNGAEKTFFDAISVEVLRLAGVDNCILWKFTAFPVINGSVSGSVDCLYGEPTIGTNPLHYKKFNVLALFQEPSHVTDALDTGELLKIEGRIYFARKNLEVAKVPANTFGDLVEPGDIVQIFLKGRFWYFDLANVERTGWVTDSQEYTHYVADMVRNSDFLPEQKLNGP